MKLIKPRPISFTPVCEQHRHYGPTPCPWVECAYGIEDNEFLLEANFLSGKGRQYRRQRWTSPESESYYSWIGEDWRPSFNDSLSIIDREIERLGQRRPIGGITVYHYTDLQGLKGILDTQGMWLTDYAYLNDSSEMEYGLGLVKQKLSQAADNPKYSKIAAIFRDWIAGLDNHQHRICISSYSLDGDSLSQWRAYGSVAIGFKLDYSLAGWNGECVINSVIYDKDEQERYLEYFVNHVLQAYELDNGKFNDVDKLKIIYQGGVHSTINLVARLKNSGFSDEREVRVAYVENPEFVDLGMSLAPKRFRISGDGIVPYVSTLDLSTDKSEPKLPIIEVVVGPTISPNGERSIREYLDYLDLRGVIVRRSAIPYRK